METASGGEPSGLCGGRSAPPNLALCGGGLESRENSCHIGGTTTSGVAESLKSPIIY